MKHRNQNKSERGQALILIALAVFGLVGLTALAVDGSHVYAQLRQAQNAADTAAFAAAIARIQVLGTDPPGTDAAALTALESAGLSRAASNKFNDDSWTGAGDPTLPAAANPGQAIDVIVNYPPDPNDPITPVAYRSDSDNVKVNEYVQVIIQAQIPTFFARIVGFNTLPVHVQAVAKAVPPHTDLMGGNNGIVALGDICNAVRTHGSGTTTLVGGGVFSNSSADGSPASCWSFNGMGTGDQIHIPNADMVGCLDDGDISGGIIVIDGGGGYNCHQTSLFYPPPAPDLGIDCASLPVGQKTGNTIRPGRWSHSLGNLGGNNAFPPNGTNNIREGVYCVDGNFIIGAGDNIQSVDSAGHPGRATFILNGSLRWDAGATIHLMPSDTGKIKGLLIYRPLNNPITGLCPGGGGNPPCQVLEFNGGANSNWTGAIYAPDSECDINGTSDSFSLHSQAICYSVDIGGDSVWTLTYDGAQAWPFPYPGETELTH